MTQQTDLLSVVLHLQPLEAPVDGAPRWWGRAAHALFLRAVAGVDPALATHLHDAADPHPFTVSTLMGPKAARGLQPDATYRLRFTAFNADAAAALLQALAPKGSLSPDQTVELDRIHFRVLPHPPEHSVWEASTTYTELAAPWITARRSPPRKWRLQFASPTTFRSAGLHVPFPLPRLVFGSLVRRWNAYAPIAVPEEETLRFATEAMAVSYYRLQTRSAPLKNGGLRIGAIGEASYRAIPYDRYWRSVVQVLASFALFAGVGAGTTMGLGQARLVDGEPAGHAPSAEESADDPSSDGSG